MSLKSPSSVLLSYLPDKPFTYLFYFKYKHRFVPLKDPKKFTEKIAWLKMFGNLERFAPYADKFTVRSYIEYKIGSEYLIPMIGVWDNVNDIPFDSLPNQFVLKVTHGCGYNYICKDKSKIDPEEVRRLLNGWMHENFYKQEREPQYKFCVPKIIGEKYLEDETGSLRDYKFWCAKGEPKIVQVDTDRFTDHKSDLFDTSWKRLDYVQATTFSGTEHAIKKPKNLPQMLQVARELSEKFPFVRVDLYSVNNKIYFGELTFTPGSGIVDMDSDDGELEIGKLVDINAYYAKSA